MTASSSVGGLRLACDTGGTFTDLVVEAPDGVIRFYKRPTTPDNPIEGLLDVVSHAAEDLGTDVERLLGETTAFIHGTTRALNAMVTNQTARTALLLTEGHPDTLLFREGGERWPPFDYSQVYPEPFIPRRRTFEVPERIGADGSVVRPIDETATSALVRNLAGLGTEAVAVCLLWSIVNPAHERIVGEILAKELPGIPFTLSHELNPTIREYRRTSSAAVDAALKPLMTQYLEALESELRDRGFKGRLLILTSAGGVLDGTAAQEAPIHVLRSGPAAAPVAGRYYTQLDGRNTTAVVGDAGGTTFDVSIVRGSEIPRTTDTVIGDPHLGTMTGFPSVDVRSVGAGGGSIGWIDAGGLLRVGPRSAGATPGPACYGNGGAEPTVTDACVALGFIDPEAFLGGAMRISRPLAEAAVRDRVGARLKLGVADAAEAILALACEHMAAAIDELTVRQGIDPRHVTFIGGGGGGGLYSVAIARRLGIGHVLLPDAAGALSAAGALLSEMEAEYVVTSPMTTDAFDEERANAALRELRARCDDFLVTTGSAALSHRVRLSVDARYPEQIFEIDVPLARASFDGGEDVERLRQQFHVQHREVFGVNDPASLVEIVAFRARIAAKVRGDGPLYAHLPRRASTVTSASRTVYMEGDWREIPVWQRDDLPANQSTLGPALIESALDTTVIPLGAACRRDPINGWIAIQPWHDDNGSHSSTTEDA